MYYNNLKITRQRGTLRAMNNYYPFGLMWDNPETMPNATYQGKELQTDTWSDGSELALYDFGARIYDPVLGRWHCAAQQFLTAAQRRFRNASPEQFGANFVDPVGRLGLAVVSMAWCGQYGATVTVANTVSTVSQGLSVMGGIVNFVSTFA